MWPLVFRRNDIVVVDQHSASLQTNTRALGKECEWKKKLAAVTTL